MKDSALVILSGGLDSTTCMAIAKSEYEKVYAVTFNYNQRHSREIISAKKVAEHYDTNLLVIEIPFLGQIGGNSLTDRSLDVKMDGVFDDEIPNTFVAGRNLIFLSMACAYAYNLNTFDIFIGVNALDYSGYPDCRPEFIKSANLAINSALGENKFNIVAPLMELSKKEIVELGRKHNAPFELTTSCYNGRENACGVCDSCILRLNGFSDAGFKDPIKYA